jgi:LPXTG-site transpeptidase (sortase) family protein
VEFLKKILYAFLLAGLLLASMEVQPVYAASIVVNTATDEDLNNGTCSLREAMIAANTDAAYNGCAAGAGADAITFAANYTITLIGSQLPVVTSPITITGNGAANTIVQANAATYRVFEVGAAGNLTLDSLTVRNGLCNGSCNGALSDGGGGIYNNGTLTITDSTISGNYAISLGGGIYNNGTLTITDSTISGNTALNGGGIYNNTGTASITNSTISGNSAAVNAGGIYNDSSLTITNNTISGNTAFNGGGGFYNNGTASIANSTFSGNGAGIGGGIYNNGTLSYSNSIIANSTAGGEDCSNFATIGTNSNNLVEDNTCSPAFSLDPSLAPLADNGGPTQTHALLSVSPAIDQGVGCPATDQRGVARPQGTGCDLGAYEFGASTLTVTSSTPTNNAVLTNLSTLTINFSEDALNNGSADAANNIANYLLVERGANANFNTQSCAGGLVADDVNQIISSAVYTNNGGSGPFTATLTLAAPLTNGNYRLFICGTTSIWSAAGLELNNGTSDAVVNFRIAPAAALASALPNTGFAPHKVTQLPHQPAELAYSAMGDIWLEIPSQNIKTNIVGVPQAENKTWDVKWLENNTGWLNGTAFPTWEGNSVLTAHVTNANGLPGPFEKLKDLKYGDQVIVHLGGQSYIFEVRTSVPVRAGGSVYAFQHLEGASYLTLITCQNYDEQTNSYRFRRVVRAVLVDVKD